MKNTEHTSKIFQLIENLPYAFVPEEIANRLRQFPRAETLAYLKDVTIFQEGNELSDRAMDAILQLDREFGKSLLLELRVSPSWEWFFCYAAIEFGDSSFVAPLCETLRNSQDATTRYMAAVALEPWGDLRATDTLTAALDDPGEDYEGRKISDRAATTLKAIKARFEH